MSDGAEVLRALKGLQYKQLMSEAGEIVYDKLLKEQQGREAALKLSRQLLSDEKFVAWAKEQEKFKKARSKDAKAKALQELAFRKAIRMMVMRAAAKLAQRRLCELAAEHC